MAIPKSLSEHGISWYVIQLLTVFIYIYTGWWFQPTPLKNDGVKVSWDDDIPFPTFYEKS